MRARIGGITMDGTPEEIAQYAAERERISNLKYSKAAQQLMFDRQESEARMR